MELAFSRKEPRTLPSRSERVQTRKYHYVAGMCFYISGKLTMEHTPRNLASIEVKITVGFLSHAVSAIGSKQNRVWIQLKLSLQKLHV